MNHHGESVKHVNTVKKKKMYALLHDQWAKLELLAV